MKVNISIERSLDVPVKVEDARKLLDDYEGLLRHFPKLRKLTRTGQDEYQWEMATIGSRTARIAHDIRYGARYHLDRQAGVLAWEALPRYGNARIEGCMRFEPIDSGTRIEFDVEGELRDVPVPMIYRLVAPPFIQGKFSRLIDIFLENTRKALQ